MLVSTLVIGTVGIPVAREWPCTLHNVVDSIPALFLPQNGCAKMLSCEKVESSDEKRISAHRMVQLKQAKTYEVTERKLCTFSFVLLLNNSL